MPGEVSLTAAVAARRDPISTITWGAGAGTISSTSSLIREVQFWFTQSTT